MSSAFADDPTVEIHPLFVTSQQIEKYLDIGGIISWRLEFYNCLSDTESTELDWIEYDSVHGMTFGTDYDVPNSSLEWLNCDAYWSGESIYCDTTLARAYRMYGGPPNPMVCLHAWGYGNVPASWCEVNWLNPFQTIPETRVCDEGGGMCAGTILYDVPEQSHIWAFDVNQLFGGSCSLYW